MLMPLFSLVEKLRTLRESLPEKAPNLHFLHSRSAESTTMCFTEVATIRLVCSKTNTNLKKLVKFEIYMSVAAQTTVPEIPGLSSGSWAFFR
jgi:hypothetical protein